MTKEKLIQYCDLKKEIQNLENRIEKIENQTETIGDVIQNGYKGRTVIYGYDFERTKKLNNLKNILKERYNKALDLQNEIEKWINAIPKSDIRQIFEYRYIYGFGWIKIMHLMKYKSESAARTKHDRFLEEIL